MDKIEKKNSLGGMLITAVLSYAVAGIISFSAITQAVVPFNFNKTWMTISNLALNSYNPQWMGFVIFQFSSSIFVVIISIALFILFVKQSRFFPMALVIYFMIRVLLLTFLFYFQTIVKGPPSPDLAQIANASFRALVITGVWIPYIMLSEKARETFIY